MSVVTKTGDKGETGVIGKRISKADQLIKTIGQIDEVNSYLGVVIAFIKNHVASSKNYGEKLIEIQSDLFTINSILAGAKISFQSRRVKELEKEIDEMEGKLPVLQNFILPGGSELSAHLMYARSLARHAEREFVALNLASKGQAFRGYFFEILKYLNRLSDYLFILARWVNFKKGILDLVWKV